MSTTTTTTTTTATTTAPGPKGVQTTMNYFVSPPEGATMKEIMTNPALTAESKSVFVNDVRGQEDKFNLAQNGFQYVKAPTEFTDFENAGHVESDYYRECEEVVMKALKPKAAFAYHHSYRLSDSPGKVPAYNVHIDRTEKASRTLVQDPTEWFSDEAREMFKTSNILNVSVWRPLYTVERDPIAVVDSQTYAPGDLVPLMRPKPPKEPRGGPRETWFVRNNDSHKWYHMSAQTKDDVLLIKFSDERGNVSDDVMTTGCPHSSFNWKASDNATPRNSVEVRVIAAF